MCMVILAMYSRFSVGREEVLLVIALHSRESVKAAVTLKAQERSLVVGTAIDRSN